MGQICMEKWIKFYECRQDVVKWNFIRHILQGYEQGIFTRYLQDEDDCS